MAVDMERLVRVYIKMRAELRKKNKEHKDFERKLKAQQDKVALEILKFLNDTKQENAKVKGGTAYKSLDILPAADDWNEVYSFIRENDAFEFLQRRIVKDAVRKYMEDNKGAVPPGMRVQQKYIVKVVARDEKTGKELSEGEEGEE